MPLKSVKTLPLLALTLLLALATALPATADTQLPGPRTHTDPSSVDNTVTAQATSPKLLIFKSATTSSGVRKGYLAVRAECNVRCDVDVTATAKINGKKRIIGTGQRSLPAKAVRIIKVKIRSDVKQRVQNGLKFSFDGSAIAPR
ncbi:MAG: hypothetical protein QOJ07_603 [Thermoleophilaceae bacterium]|jgi:hypothetical protein|nr:hypothetical protein [Thermoleophilaceae bacterium]